MCRCGINYYFLTGTHHSHPDEFARMLQISVLFGINERNHNITLSMIYHNYFTVSSGNCDNQ